ncbi:hypothetical protein LP21_03255 [Listeria monocytogenes]|nr:hypothetical protein [Listeria monocytogenes]EAD0294070.1 hypothetical protein [Listeria monocytogenes]EAF1129607.1 hypothetical protein [Listeria monocytogenes]EAG4663970.1 hypothetical protein [Listeria monocytogenes]
MSVEVTGVEELERQLVSLFGRENLPQLVDPALVAGAALVAKTLKSEFVQFKDTGASIDEINIEKPSYDKGVRSIKIDWKGPKDRYKIIHLNEYGYTRNGEKITPTGTGSIARSLRISERAYRAIVQKKIGDKL